MVEAKVPIQIVLFPRTLFCVWFVEQREVFNVSLFSAKSQWRVPPILRTQHLEFQYLCAYLRGTWHSNQTGYSTTNQTSSCQSGCRDSPLGKSTSIQTSSVKYRTPNTHWQFDYWFHLILNVMKLRKWGWGFRVYTWFFKKMLRRGLELG